MIKFIDEVFGLTPLADLPDEVTAPRTGLEEPLVSGSSGAIGWSSDSGIGDLTEAFDYAVLRGEKQPISSSAATIPANRWSASYRNSTPPGTGPTNGACKAIGMLPNDCRPSWSAYDAGQPIDPLPPSDFNPRPSASPGTPTAGGWTP